MATMRTGILTLALFLLFGVEACHQVRPQTSSVKTQSLAISYTTSTGSKPDFATEIKPIFQARCQPCHFQGGQVYDKMPFDKPETITRLGTKLFTRIKDEKEQRLIRAFLDQP